METGRGELSTGVLFLQDTALAHKSQISMSMIHDLNLAGPDFLERLKWRKFSSKKEIIKIMTSWLQNNVILKKLQKLWEGSNKCIT